MSDTDFDDISEEQTKLLRQLVGVSITQNYRPGFLVIVNSTGEITIRAFALDKGQNDITYTATEPDLQALKENKYITISETRPRGTNDSLVNGGQANYRISLNYKAEERIASLLKKNGNIFGRILNLEKSPNITQIIVAIVSLIGVIITVYFGYFTQVERPAQLTATSESIHWTATAKQVESETALSVMLATSIPSVSVTSTFTQIISPSPSETGTLKPILSKAPTITVTSTRLPTSTFTLTAEPTPDPSPIVSGPPTLTPYPTPQKVINPNNKIDLTQLALWKTNSAVYSVAVSPNGEWVASGEQNNTVTVRSLTTGTILHSLDYGSLVRQVAFSRDGKWLAAAGNGKVITVWRTDTWGSAVMITGHTGTISSISFSQNGNLLASGGYDDKTIRLWKVGTWELQQVINSPKEVNVVAFSPDSKSIAVGINDSMVRVWDISGTFQYKLEDIGAASDAVISLAFSPDGQLLVSGTRDIQHPFQVWDFIKHELINGIGGPFQGTTVTFSPDGLLIVTGDSSNTIRIWRASNITILRYIENKHQDVIYSMAFSMDGKLLITGSRDKTIRVWGIK